MSTAELVVKLDALTQKTAELVASIEPLAQALVPEEARVKAKLEAHQRYCNTLTVGPSILASALIVFYLNPALQAAQTAAVPVLCLLGFLFAEASVIFCAIVQGDGCCRDLYHIAGLTFVASLCFAVVAMIVCGQQLYSYGVFVVTAACGSVGLAIFVISYMVSTYYECSKEGKNKKTGGSGITVKALSEVKAQTS